MTANLEPRGLDEGFEVGLRLDSQAVEELQKIVEEWYEKAPYRWESSKALQSLPEGKILFPSGQNFKEEEIKGQTEVETTSKPQDLVEMQELLESNPDIAPYLKNSYSKKIRLTRRIFPPILPPQADKVNPKVYHQSRHSASGETGKPKYDSFPVSVYRHKNRYYAVIKDWKEFRKVKDDPSLPPQVIYVTQG